MPEVKPSAPIKQRGEFSRPERQASTPNLGNKSPTSCLG